MSIETLKEAKEVVANKEHRCCFCGEKIHPKSKYITSTHKYDGQVYDWKTHTYCNKLADTLKMYEDADEGVTEEHFTETVSEEFYTILHGLFSKEDVIKYQEALIQLKNVRWHDKLWFVIRHHNKN